MSVWPNLSAVSGSNADGGLKLHVKHKLSDINLVRESLDVVQSSKRSYYSLTELCPQWDCSVAALLDLGYQGKLKLSVIAAKWKTRMESRSGAELLNGEKCWERIASGHVALAVETIQELIRTGTATVQDLWAPPDCEVKIVVGVDQQFPIVVVADVYVQRRDAIDYLKSRITELQPQALLEPVIANTKTSWNYKPRTTDQIAALFRLHKEPGENQRIWRKFAHHAKRNRLATARTVPSSSKQGRKQSYYCPGKVGKWLVDENHMDSERVKRILEDLLGESLD